MALVQELTLLFIMVWGLIGNSLVIRVIYCNVLMQTMGNKFAFSMALADLGLCLLFMPFSLISLFHQEWIFGHNMCYITAICGELFTRASTIILSVVVLEKHLNVIHRNLKRLSRNGVFLLFFVLWLTACAFSVPCNPRTVFYDQYVGNCVFIKSPDASLASILTFSLLEGWLFKVVPVILLVVSFIKVFKKIYTHRCVAQSENKHNLMNIDRLRIMADDYTACTTLIVVTFYVLLCLPYIVTQLLSLCFDVTIPTSWQTTAYWFVLFNTAIRPLIYGLRNRRSRNLMLRCYKRAKRNLITQNCYARLARRKRAYVIPVAQHQTEQTQVKELQVVDVYRSHVSVVDIAASATPLFTRRRVLTVQTINTTSEQTFLDLNCVPYECDSELNQIVKDCYEMTSSAMRVKGRDDRVFIQDIESEEESLPSSDLVIKKPTFNNSM